MTRLCVQLKMHVFNYVHKFRLNHCFHNNLIQIPPNTHPRLPPEAQLYSNSQHEYYLSLYVDQEYYMYVYRYIGLIFALYSHFLGEFLIHEIQGSIPMRHMVERFMLSNTNMC